MIRKKSPLPEKRYTKRRFISYYMRVFDKASGQQIGHLVDITSQGAMVISEEPLPEGKHFRLNLELTDDVADKPFLEFSARSIWCRSDIDPRRYNTGFEIASLHEEDGEIVRRIVKKYGFRENQPPTPLR